MTLLQSGLAKSGAVDYTIDQSLRFERTDSSYFNRTPGSSGDRSTFTISCWIKRGRFGYNGVIASAGDSVSSDPQTMFWISDDNTFRFASHGGTGFNLTSDAVYRDPSAWYHFVAAIDTTQATAADRGKFYVNGELITVTGTYPAQDAVTDFNYSSAVQYIGVYVDHGVLQPTYYYDGYLAELYLIDGTQYAASDFGETSSTTNQWIPKDASGLTFGTNGYYFKFQDSAALGDDSSGNGNDYTVNNLAATDQMKDSPTNNFSTMNPLAGGDGSGGGQALSEGNLSDLSQTDNTGIPITFGIPGSGKWYFEWYIPDYGATSLLGLVAPEVVSVSSGDASAVGFWLYNGNNGYIYGNGAYPAYGTAWGVDGNLVGVAVDMDNGALYFSLNNTWQNSGDPESGASKTGAATTDLLSTGYDWVPCFKGQNPSYQSIVVFNAGQDSSFAGNKTAQGNADANDIGDFYYEPPADYLALCSSNLPDPEIKLPGENFNTVLYTGTDSSNAITGVGFSPNLLSIKNRTSVAGGLVFDVDRGQNFIQTDNSAVEADGSAFFTSLDSDGFTVTGSNLQANASGNNYVAWNWLAGGAPTADNDNTTGAMDANSVALNGSLQAAYTPSGSPTIYPTRMSIGTTSGFSIVSYSGNSVAGATIPHGLSQAPNMVFFKRLTYAGNWIVGSDELTSWDYYIDLATDLSEADYDFFNDTGPTASVISLSSAGAINYDNTLAANGTYIAYCFHSVEGYSKVGSYTGNANADGTFIYTGFSPAWVLIKPIGLTGDWYMYDNKRMSFNVLNDPLYANLTAAENTGSSEEIDFVSNGIKIRGAGSGTNPATNILYIAFAEYPFKYANAR